MERVLDAARKHGVAMECNSYPDRLDLKDTHLRMAKDRGVKIVISTDSHSTTNLQFIRYGVLMARRGWLEKSDVLNTLPVDALLGALRPKAGWACPVPPATVAAAKRGGGRTRSAAAGDNSH